MMIQNTSPLQILKRPIVEQRTGLSRSAIYELISCGAFPKPVHLSARSVGWLSHEIDHWIQSRMAQRPPTSPLDQGMTHEDQ